LKYVLTLWVLAEDALDYVENEIELDEILLECDAPVDNPEKKYEENVRTKQSLEKILQITESGLGPFHVNTLRAVRDLGCHYIVMGDYEGARPHLERALMGRVQTLGPLHADTKRSLKDLSALDEKIGSIREKANPGLSRIKTLTRINSNFRGTEQDVLWRPPEELEETCAMTKFMRKINGVYGMDMSDYETLHRWSINNSPVFWSECWTFVDAQGSQGAPLVDNLDDMMSCRFFPNSVFNFAQNCLQRRDNGIAIMYNRELIESYNMTWLELYNSVGQLATALRADGLKKGDRVCAVVANTAQTVICMLATATIGAIWSSVSPDFGVEGILERFSQIEPKVFFYCDHYFVKNKAFRVDSNISQVRERLHAANPLIAAVCISNNEFSEYMNRPRENTPVFSGDIVFEPTNFNDPLFILFSSGTTGKPKCIVHRHGALLQLMKEHQLHSNIRQDDRVFYYTTYTWMMWNWLIGVLASKATILLWEGNPFYPDCNALLQFAGSAQATFFGVSGKYIDSLKSSPDFRSPGASFDTVRTIASTGSPLVPESFDFVYSHIKKDVNLASICGGTDILSCFVLGCPIKTVRRGFVQCRGLGMAVEVWDPDAGAPIVGEKGELVCVRSFPSQPVGFWGDFTEKVLYRNAYFGEWDNIWKHGDFVLMDPDGEVIVYGRSDTTLKPGGVRIGTAEIYRAVESLDFVKEAICCGIELKFGDESVALFVTLRDPTSPLNDYMRDAIRKAVVKSATRHHVPKIIEQVPDIPRTKSGKIVELAVKNILHKRAIKNLNALANAEALEHFKPYAVDWC
jgi:acetoacetyl-CoA synthetase